MFYAGTKFCPIQFEIETSVTQGYYFYERFVLIFFIKCIKCSQLQILVGCYIKLNFPNLTSPMFSQFNKGSRNKSSFFLVDSPLRGVGGKGLSTKEPPPPGGGWCLKAIVDCPLKKILYLSASLRKAFNHQKRRPDQIQLYKSS